MKRFCTDLSSYLKFKERNEQWKNDGYPMLDKSLELIVPHLNTIPGIQTVLSCSGHLYPTGVPSDYRFMVLLAVTEEGLDNLTNLYIELGKAIALQDLWCHFSINIQYLTTHAAIDDGDFIARPTFSLEAWLPTHEIYTAFYSIFDSSIQHKLI